MIVDLSKDSINPFFRDPFTKQISHRTSKNASPSRVIASIFRHMCISWRIESLWMEGRLEFLWVKSVGYISSVAIITVVQTTGYRVPTPFGPANIVVDLVKSC